MSTKTEDELTAWSLSNTRMTPDCSTTNQRVLSPGACSIATGREKVRFGKARESAIGVPEVKPPPPPPPAATREQGRQQGERR